MYQSSLPALEVIGYWLLVIRLHVNRVVHISMVQWLCLHSYSTGPVGWGFESRPWQNLLAKYLLPEWNTGNIAYPEVMLVQFQFHSQESYRSINVTYYES